MTSIRLNSDNKCYVHTRINGQCSDVCQHFDHICGCCHKINSNKYKPPSAACDDCCIAIQENLTNLYLKLLESLHSEN
jgi:hypothetical protein